jgi:PAS domain S-box-containing protein
MPAAPDAVLSCALDAVVTLDELGGVLDMNRAAERMFGMSAAEARGRPAADTMVPPRLRAAHAADLRRLSDRDRDVRGGRMHSHARRADGSEFPIELTLSRTDESPLRVVAWIRDMTELHAEAACQQALLDSAEQVAGIGSWEWIPSEDRLVWSDNLCRMFGLLPGERAPTPELALERTHPDDRETLVRAFQQLEQGRLRPFRYRILLDDGVVRYVRATLAVAERRDGRAYRMVGSLQDLTDRRRAEQEIAAHVAVCEALVQWESLDGDAERLLAGLAGALDCTAGALWVPEDDALVARVTWHDPATAAPLFTAATRRVRLRRGSGLPGRAWECGQPLGTVGYQQWDLRGLEAERDGLHSAVAVPAVHGDEVLAVVELNAAHDAELTPRLVRSLTGIGHELGEFLGRRRGELDAPLLTPRELEVLRLGSSGHSVRQSAEALALSPATVKTHLEKIYVKLGVSDKACAVATALRLGLIQ